MHTIRSTNTISMAQSLWSMAVGSRTSEHEPKRAMDACQVQILKRIKTPIHGGEDEFDIGSGNRILEVTRCGSE